MIGANSMGVQFWWFYDVIAAAVILLCIFLIVRKGLVKASITLTGFVIAVVTAFSGFVPTIVSSNILDILYSPLLLDAL